MSLSGQLLRGLKWYNFRSAIQGKGYDKFGEVFLPKDITEHPHKINELNFYLDFVKTRNEKKVCEILEKVMLFDLKNKEAARVEEAKKLDDPKLLTKSKGKK